jgi:hypothetical protein
MTVPIPICMAVEDELTESLALRILQTISTEYAIETIYNRGGYGYLRKTIGGYNNAAKGMPFLVGTDLDRYPCPTALLADWLAHPKHHNLLICVAVREAEAWVLADCKNFAQFIGISPELVPVNVEALPDPKDTLIRLARKSRWKQLRDDICPSLKSTSKIGPNYNARLGNFVNTNWDPTVARTKSRSLDRMINRLVEFRPQWPAPADL